MSKILRGFFIVILCFIVNACNNKKKTIVDFNVLSEIEKRKPENALASMHVAEDLNFNLFANEPMLSNPTNMAIDAKGRVWVCEGRNYRLFANQDNTYDDKGDRILILEDTDGDGKADSSKVFYQGEDINSALGIVVLGNKVIVSVSPNVFVFTDDNADDIPDSKEILFSGIEGVDHDHGVHAFVFGADGRLYFNYGNNGKKLLDAKGNLKKDIYGDEISADGNPYRQGMAFRMETDGSDIEILGYNFRNPFELAVDSYGAIWQSDNDDDGNRGVRINYLMEYGNYGYKDQLTGANWRERRTGWEDKTPFRHWHLNDPGTVPNVLQTGSGSPTGILVYEGEMLPKLFQNQLIHCEPGHNVVRSYILKDEEAGYSARIENLVKSDDNWFRPSDVTVASDGSLFISDWYDGGVGGHKAEDLNKGRIYRLSTNDVYEPKTFKYETAEDAANGLLSNNMDVFYQSWQKFNSMGKEAESELKKLIGKGGIAKARALWLAAMIPNKAKDYIKVALADKDLKYRMQGLRMARYLDSENLESYVAEVVRDSSIQVRREAAIALRYIGTLKAAELWTKLAKQHTAKNRWYLEALGIGSDKFADLYFNTWVGSLDKDQITGASKEIIWRVHAQSSVPMLVDIIKDEKVDVDKLPSYFRALSFKEHPNKNKLILNLLGIEHPHKKDIKALVVGQLDADFVNNSTKNIQLVKSILPSIEGTPEWILALNNLKISGQNNALFRVISNADIDEDIRKEAITLLFNSDGYDLVISKFHSNSSEIEKMELLTLLGGSNDSKVIDILINCLESDDLGVALKKRTVEVLGNTWDGRHKLYELLEKNKLPKEYKTTAVLKLMNSWDAEIRKNAPKFLEKSENDTIDIEMLVAKNGDVKHGKEVFTTFCASCHIAGDIGVEFGPELSDIGNKLAKGFLYSNIVQPSAGISFGFEGYSISTKDGKNYTGYILNKTEDELTLKMMGNTQVILALSDIVKQEAMEQSLMTEGLYKIMSQEELVDLVEFLTTLKVEENEIVASN